MTDTDSKSVVIDRVYLGIVGFGITLRLLLYLWNPSLWIDEILLAVNLVERGPIELFEPLDYFQAAPVGFLLVVNTLTACLGHSEWALRLFPFLCSCVAQVWMLVYAKRYLAPLLGIYVCAILAFAPLFIYYSVDVKPYSLDLLISVMLLHAFCSHATSLRAWVLCCLAVIVAPWFSYPSVFVISGLSAGLIGYWALQRKWNVIAQPLVLGLIGIGSFSVVYFLCVRTVSSDEGLNSYWDQAYFVAPYLSLRNLDIFAQGLELSSGIAPLNFRVMVGVKVLMAVSLLWGLIRFPRQTLPSFVVVCAVLLAAALGLYPFQERLLVFLIPFIAIVSGQILAEVKWGDSRLKGYALVICIVVLGWNWQWNFSQVIPPDRQDVRGALQYVAEHRLVEDPVFVVAPVDLFCDYYRACGVEIPYSVLEEPVLEYLQSRVEGVDAFWIVSESRREDQMTHIQSIMNTLGEAGKLNQIRNYSVSYIELKGMLILHLYTE